MERIVIDAGPARFVVQRAALVNEIETAIAAQPYRFSVSTDSVSVAVRSEPVSAYIGASVAMIDAVDFVSWRGTVTGYEFNVADGVTTYKCDTIAPSDGDTFPPVIDTTFYPHTTTADTDAPYLAVFGECNAPALWLDTWIGQYKLCASCVATGAASVDVTDTAAATSVTVPIATERDNNGRLIEYADLSAMAGADPSVTYTLSGFNTRFTLHDLLTRVATSTRGIDVNIVSVMAIRQYTGGILLGFYVDDRVDWISWIKTHIIPIFPLACTQGPRGIVFQWIQPTERNSVAVSFDLWDLQSYTDDPTDIGPITVEYNYSPAGGTWSKYTDTGPTPTAPPLTIQARAVSIEGVAAIVAYHARAHKTRSRVAHYKTASKYVGTLRPGDCVRVTDSRLPWRVALGYVAEMNYTRNDCTVSVHFTNY